MIKHCYVALACLFASPALAHETTGPNGGKLVDAGAYHVELVAKGRNVEVYLTDSADKPLPAAGFKGTAILVVDGKPQRLTLVRSVVLLSVCGRELLLECHTLPHMP